MYVDAPKANRLDVTSESGEMPAFEERGKGVVKIEEAFLARKAYSVAVDARHGVSWALPDVNGHAVLRIVTPTTE